MNIIFVSCITTGTVDEMYENLLDQAPDENIYLPTSYNFKSTDLTNNTQLNCSKFKYSSLTTGIVNDRSFIYSLIIDMLRGVGLTFLSN